MKEAHPKRKKAGKREEGPWVTVYVRACSGQEDYMCVDCAWDRAIELVKDNKEKSDV